MAPVMTMGLPIREGRLRGVTEQRRVTPIDSISLRVDRELRRLADHKIWDPTILNFPYLSALERIR